MSKALIGRKVGMTQLFDDVGNRIPVTVVEVKGNVVVQKKSEQGKDGYSAIKIGYGDVKLLEKEGAEARFRLSRPRVGVFTKAGIDAPRRYVRELRVSEDTLAQYEVGQVLGADHFTAGEWVDVVGTSKGRGYTGVMKRHNFAGAKGSHGVHEFFRHGGSIGASAYPSRVFPGKKMAGQYGNTRVTIQNLRVYKVLNDDNVLLIKGCVPGPNGGIVMVKTAVKKAIR